MVLDSLGQKKNDITGQHGFPHVHFEFLKKKWSC